jgi:uncharacterized protein (DUF2267 family)
MTSVLTAIGEAVPQREMDGLADSLPPEVMLNLRRAREAPDPYFDSQLFLGWVMTTVDSTGPRDKTSGGLDLYAAYSADEALRRCQCVFAVLKSQMQPQQRDKLAALLPDGVAAWFLRA